MSNVKQCLTQTLHCNKGKAQWENGYSQGKGDNMIIHEICYLNLVSINPSELFMHPVIQVTSNYMQRQFKKIH